MRQTLRWTRFLQILSILVAFENGKQRQGEQQERTLRQLLQSGLRNSFEGRYQLLETGRGHKVGLSSVHTPNARGELYAYEPDRFRRIRRQIFAQSSKQIVSSLCERELDQMSANGRSGSAFYISADGQFIVKTLRGREADTLLRLLPSYQRHMTPAQSLLPRFYGLFSLQFRPRTGSCWERVCRAQSSRVHFVVMDNLFAGAPELSRKFDLKGSIRNRRVKGAEGTGKDLDFNEWTRSGQELFLRERVYARLGHIVERDVAFLEAQNFMDYSLLLGIGQRASEWRSEKETHRRDVTWATNGRGEHLTLRMGIIDILQEYDWRKELEHFYKAVLYGSDQISVNNPERYARRFKRYILRGVLNDGGHRKRGTTKKGKRRGTE